MAKVWVGYTAATLCGVGLVSADAIVGVGYLGLEGLEARREIKPFSGMDYRKAAVVVSIRPHN